MRSEEPECGFAARAAAAAAGALAWIAATACAPAPQPQKAVLSPIDGPGYHHLVRASQGQPLVVNFWATWCEPCREEIPALEALHAERGEKVRVVGVSVDDPARAAQVRKYLARQGVSFPQYIRSDADDEAFIAAVDPDWDGAVPATFVYDGAGTRTARLIGQQDRQSLESAIDPLLGDRSRQP
jgi:thiol-disulfide isomerase/thioredoxin